MARFVEIDGQLIYKELYGEGEKPHHIWCNFTMRNGPCKQCDKLYKNHPMEEGADLMKNYFPQNIRRT